MRLVSYGEPGAWTAGLLVGQKIVDLAEAAVAAGLKGQESIGLGSVRGFLALPGEARQAVAAAAAGLKGKSLDSVRLGPPVPDPRKIVCIGLNYHDHAEEVGVAAPKAPIFFAKFDNSLVGPADDITPPPDTQQIDYEAELAVVIGRRGRMIPEAEALDYVFGAMALNDVSARDLQMANQLWSGGKAIDSFAPCGPALVSKDELGDLQNLGLRTWLNGELLQDGNTANMIFGIAPLIAFLSRIMTLEPGDIVATGTPAGVGLSRKPQIFMKPGDLVEVEAEGIGKLSNRVAAPFGPLPG